MKDAEDNLYTYDLGDDCVNEGIPIPDKKGNSDNTANRFIGVPDKKRTEHLKNIYDSVVKMNRGPLKGTFITQAQKLKSYTVSDAVHVPFNCYWPSYEVMSDHQKKWYFFWRAQVRSGIFPETDLSYIFLYIYELINNVGVENACDGFTRLCIVWSSYRKAYPSLDRYMVPWIQDYISINDCGIKPSEMLQNPPDERLVNLFPDSVIAWYINRSDEELPIELISQFCDYRYYKSKFYEQDKDNLMIKLIPPVFKYINKHLIMSKGKGIFDIYKPEKALGRQRLPFQNAIYQGEVRSVNVEQISYTNYQPFRDFITNVIRHLENRLREKTGFRGKLKVDEMDKEISSAIDRFVNMEFDRHNAAKNFVKVKVDKDKIVQLIHDSNIIRQKLLSGLNEDIAEQAGNDAAADTGSINLYDSTISSDISYNYNGSHNSCSSDNNDDNSYNSNDNSNDTNCNSNDNSNDTNCNSIDNSNTICDDACYNTGDDSSNNSSSNPFNMLAGALDLTGHKLIKLIIQNDFCADDSFLQSAFPNIFIQTVIDNVNNLALDTAGDIMIEHMDGQWVIIDDYRNDLALAFNGN